MDGRQDRRHERGVMALIACTECKKEISDKAAACPNCGAPLQASSPAGIPSTKTSSRTPLLIFGIAFSVCLVAGIAFLVVQVPGKPSISDAEQRELMERARKVAHKQLREEWKEKLEKEGKGPSKKYALEAMESGSRAYATTNLLLEKIAKAKPQNSEEAALLERGKEHQMKAASNWLDMANAGKDLSEALDAIDKLGATEILLQRIVEDVTRINESSKNGSAGSAELAEQLRPILQRK